MTARILDATGVAMLLALLMLATVAHLHAADAKPKTTDPKPTVVVYDMCADDSIPWYFKLDCLWK